MGTTVVLWDGEEQRIDLVSTAMIRHGINLILATRAEQVIELFKRVNADVILLGRDVEIADFQEISDTLGLLDESPKLFALGERPEDYPVDLILPSPFSMPEFLKALREFGLGAGIELNTEPVKFQSAPLPARKSKESVGDAASLAPDDGELNHAADKGTFHGILSIEWLMSLVGLNFSGILKVCDQDFEYFLLLDSGSVIWASGTGLETITERIGCDDDLELSATEGAFAGLNALVDSGESSDVNIRCAIESAVLDVLKKIFAIQEGSFEQSPKKLSSDISCQPLLSLMFEAFSHQTSLGDSLNFVSKYKSRHVAAGKNQFAAARDLRQWTNFELERRIDSSVKFAKLCQEDDGSAPDFIPLIHFLLLGQGLKANIDPAELSKAAEIEDELEPPSRPADYRVLTAFSSTIDEAYDVGASEHERIKFLESQDLKGYDSPLGWFEENLSEIPEGVAAQTRMRAEAVYEWLKPLLEHRVPSARTPTFGQYDDDDDEDDEVEVSMPETMPILADPIAVEALLDSDLGDDVDFSDDEDDEPVPELIALDGEVSDDDDTELIALGGEAPALQKSPEAMRDEGWALLELGDAESAKPLFMELTSLHEVKIRDHLGLGQAIFALGSSEAMAREAAGSFNQALQLNPNDPDANAWMAEALCAMGNDLGVRPFLLRALQFDAEHEHANLILKRIDG